MLKVAISNIITNHNFLGAVDVFTSIQKVFQTLNKNMFIIGPVIFVVSILGGALAFSFGRKGAESGKSHIWNVVIGVFIFLAAASVVATLFKMFGATANGI